MAQKSRPEKSKSGRKVRHEFVYDSGYRLYAANGAWGGPGGESDFRLDFFVDHPKNPNGLVRDVLPDGSVGPEQREPREDDMVYLRRVQFGVIMPLDQAESIGNFIVEKVAEHRKLLKKQEEI